MASGWRSLQTLNVGNQPTHAQNTSGALPRQRGVWIINVQWTGFTTGGHTFSISDPNDSTLILLQGNAGTTLVDQQYLVAVGASWRDFKLTQISSGTLLIWYR